MHAYRTHTCAEPRAAHVGDKVRLSGWIHRKRDHGGVLFVDLRDHYGITQIVADQDNPVQQLLDSLRVESVITVTGEIVARAAEAVNPKLPTGEIEVVARELDVQSHAAELPMPVAGDADYPEEIRLKYRYLDLRRDQVHRNIILRSAVIASIRRRREMQETMLSADELALAPLGRRLGAGALDAAPILVALALVSYWWTICFGKRRATGTSSPIVSTRSSTTSSACSAASMTRSGWRSSAWWRKGTC